MAQANKSATSMTPVSNKASTTAASIPATSTISYASSYAPSTLSELASISHLHLTQNGLDVVVGEILSQSSSGAINRRVTRDEIVQWTLNRSLSGIGARVLPEPSKSITSTFPSTAWLQIQSARDISKSSSQQRSTDSAHHSHRMWQLELTDGVTTMMAIEFGPLQFTVHQLIPGSKLLIKFGTRIMNHILLLDSNSVGPLQGRVESLASAHLLQLTASQRRDAATPLAPGEKPPPKFRPFSERHLVQAEREREREIERARKEQEQVALARTTPAVAPMKLMPPPEIEEATGQPATTATSTTTKFPCTMCHKTFTQQSNLNRHMKVHAGAAATTPSTTTPATAASTTSGASASSTASSVKPTTGVARDQLALEEEFHAQERAKLDAATATAASNAARAAKQATTAGAVTPNVLSSFRTLLTAPLNSIQSFSAQILDVQLYPPKPPNNDFILQLTLTDAFGLRASAIAAQRIFEALFSTQEQFRKSMAEPAGQALIQKRLQTVRTKLCNKQFLDVELEIKASSGGTTAASRTFLMHSLGEIVKARSRMVQRLTAPVVKEIPAEEQETDARIAATATTTGPPIARPK